MGEDEEKEGDSFINATGFIIIGTRKAWCQHLVYGTHQSHFIASYCIISYRIVSPHVDDDDEDDDDDEE